MKLTLFKDFSDASSIITVQAGVPLCQQVETDGRRIIANGAEVSETYLPEENDIIIMRTIPGELTTILLLISAVALIGGVVGGIEAYNARNKVDQLEDKMKNMNDSVANVPNLRGASNAVATGKTQPYLMGRHLFTPYFLSQPHYVLGGVDGADQYYYATLEAGFRKQVIKSVSADDIVLKTFSDSSPQEGSYSLDAGPFYDSSSRIEISQDGAAFADANFNRKYITEYPGKELKKSDADDYEDLIFTLPEKARDVSLAISFRGLRAYSDSDGAKINRTVVVKPYYSYNNGATWTEFTFNQNGTASNTFTRNVAAELRFAAYKEFAFASVKDLASPVLIKLVCETPKATGTALDQVYVQWVQSRIYDPDASAAAGAFVDEKPIADTEAALSTRIGIKLKATQTNEDKLGKINVVSQGVARTWTGSAWTATKSQTSNAAAWLLEVLTSDTHLPSQLDDSEIDLDAFGELYEVCAAEGFNVNHVITDGDEKGAALEMLCDICACTLYQNIYGEVSVAVDAPKMNSIAILNTQNLLRFEVEREFSRKADGIRITYIDSGSYKQDSYLVMRDGKTRTSNSIIRDMTVRGITDYEQVVKYARRLLALEALRPRTVRASVGKEGIYYTPLSRVLVQHPALSVGLGSAEIKSVIVEGGSITALELYEPIGEGAAIVQAVGADYCTPLEIEYTGSGTEIELVTPIPSGAAVVPHPGDILSWGSGLETVTEEMLIAGIEPTAEGFDLTLVDYDEAIYEPGAIPLYTPNLSYVAAPVSAPVGIPGATLEDVNAITGTLSTAPATPASLTARAVQDGIILLAAPGGSPGLDNSAAYYRYQVSRDGGLTWPRDWTAAAQAEYRFDRDVDGYPDSVSLYRARVKAVSAAGVESVSWLTVSVDGTGYLGWTPGTPGVSGAADNRTAELRLVQAAGYYGHSRFEVQIQRDGDGANWYAPGDSGAARSSETAYRSTLNGYATAYADTFAQTLPLINQAVGLPVNTSYLYRIRAVVAMPTTAAPDAVARSAWTAAITVVAKPTGTVDIVEKAVKHAQLDDDAVWLNNLNVLAKNLVNDLTDDADGTTGWTTSNSGVFSRVLDMSLTPDYMVGRITALARVWTTSFVVAPNDIIELEYSMRAPGAATTGEACVGYSGSSEYYEYAAWDATSKAWGAFGGNNDVIQLNVSTASLNTSYKRLLSYVVGINVQPDAIPAPENGLTSTTYCARTKSGVARMSIVNRAGTGDLYIFAPSARRVGSGKIVAQQIVTPNLAAISAKLGEIEGDTADYKLVMGSGGSAEEGTLLLGATTDASYFRRWKEGGIWKMAIKLATLFVDAVSSKILGIFRVRNSADTSTVFEVDPVTGKMDHDGGRVYRFRAYNATAGMYWCRVCKIGMNATSGNNRFHIRITGKDGWNGTNAPGHIDIDGSTNYYTSSYPNLCGVGGIARHFRGNSATTLTGKTADDIPVEVCSSVYFVQQPGYNRQEVDVYLRWDTSHKLLSYLIEVVLDRASGESVTKYGTFTATDPTTGATDYYKLPMRRVIEESPTGLTTLAAVTASSLAVSGNVSAASASVAGNAQVGSLNGATPGGGGLELLQQQALGDGWAETLANSVRLSGIAQDGSSASYSITNPSIGKSTSTLAFCYTYPNFLDAYSWNGSVFSKVGATDGSFSTMRRKIAVSGNVVVIASESFRTILCRKWNGSSFESLANGPTLSGSNLPVAVCELYTRAAGRMGFTAYAFADTSTGTIKVYEVGSNYSYHDLGWSLIYTQSIAGISSGRCELAKIADGVIALFNYGKKRIEIYKWVGSTLTAGPTLSFPSASSENALTSFSTGLLGFHECATNTFHTIAYSGTALEIIDSSALSVGSSVGIAAVTATQMALASSSGFIRMYKRVPGGVPRVSREFTQWGPSYSLAFEAGTTYAHIYTTITSIQGTADKYWGVYGNYATGALCVMRCTTSAVYFYNNVGVGQLTATKDSSTAIIHRLVVGFTV